jgi:hypothetical protein
MYVFTGSSNQLRILIGLVTGHYLWQGWGPKRKWWGIIYGRGGGRRENGEVFEK